MRRSTAAVRLAVATLIAVATLVTAPGAAGAEVDASEIQTHRAETVPLTFHFPSQYRSAVDKLEKRGEGAVPDLVRELGLESLPHVDVWVLPEVADFFRVTGAKGSAPTWSIGLSLSDRQTVIVARDTQLPGPSSSNLEKTFVHELAHVAIDAAKGDGEVPRWFHEGVALSQAREWTPERRQQLVRAASTGSLVPLADLADDFPAHHNVASLAYAESVHFVRHLESDYGRDVTARIMQKVRDGATFEMAVDRATGRSLAALESAWREQLSSQTSWLSLLQDEFAIFFAATFLFVIAWWVQRRRRQLGESDDSDDADWSYDESKYPLPGRPRESRTDR